MQDFRTLDVWKRAVDNAIRCYSVTDRFPGSERYGLTSQMRRSAVSIGSNIAEGCGRGSSRDFARFLRMAFGSACELETQAYIAMGADIGERTELESLVAETEGIRRMLSSLLRRVRVSTGEP